MAIIIAFKAVIIPETVTKIIVAAFIIVLLAGLVYLYRIAKLAAVKCLDYSLEFSVNGAFEGQEIILTETVYNRTLMPLFRVDFEVFVFNELKVHGLNRSSDISMQLLISRFSIMPFMKIKRRHVISCEKRGYYKLDTAMVYMGDTPTYFKTNGEIYVYPKIVKLNELSRPENNLQGDCVSPRRLIVDPFSVSGIREYRTGDSFNSINFKATAKNGAQKIMVNNRDCCATRIMMLCMNFQTAIDSRISSEEYDKMMEKALSYAASLIEEGIRNGYRVGFTANCCMQNGDISTRFPISAGMHSYEEMLTLMALIRAREGISFNALLNSEIERSIGETEIYIFTSYVNDYINEQIGICERLNNRVHVIMLTAEES